MKGALVTGGAKRIGAGLARALAEDGYAVFIHYRSSAAEAKALADGIAAAGGRARAVRADLADAGQVEGLIAACAETGPPLTVLINSASLFTMDLIGDMTADGWNRHMAVNALAPTLLARDFAKALPEGEAGVIINLLDQKLINLNPDFFTYTISKFALKGVTETLAMAMAPRVRVCGLAPGLTLPSSAQTKEQFEKAHAMSPLGTGSTVADLVRAMRFILQTPSYTGQMLTVDGGEHLAKRKRDVSYSVT